MGPPSSPKRPGAVQLRGWWWDVKAPQDGLNSWGGNVCQANYAGVPTVLSVSVEEAALPPLSTRGLLRRCRGVQLQLRGPARAKPGSWYGTKNGVGKCGVKAVRSTAARLDTVSSCGCRARLLSRLGEYATACKGFWRSAGNVSCLGRGVLAQRASHPRKENVAVAAPCPRRLLARIDHVHVHAPMTRSRRFPVLKNIVYLKREISDSARISMGFLLL